MPLVVPSSKSRLLPSSSGNSPQTHRIKFVPHLDQHTPRFQPITRDLEDGGPPLRIVRWIGRTDSTGVQDLDLNRLEFKSQVVSRAHAELWLNDGKFYIKDTKSASGTFLNRLRLCDAKQESKPFQVQNGDILQLGVDYHGGDEDIHKSVKIRIEIGREWQTVPNAFK